jgi:hypothetical protein
MMSATWSGFLKAVFEAKGEPRSVAPAEITIGDSIVMVSDGGGERETMPAFLHVYVADADETYDRAIAAGAEPIESPADMPYGDRRARSAIRGETCGRSRPIGETEASRRRSDDARRRPVNDHK